MSGSVRLSSTGWGPFGRNAMLVMLNAASLAGDRGGGNALFELNARD